jgi:hypothetical protein
MKNLRLYLLMIGGIVSLSSCAWATTLQLGSTTSGSIGSAGQTNVYTFSASANEVVDFTMTTTSGNLSPELKLYNSSGTLIASASNGFCSGASIEMNVVTLTAAGTYTLDVSDCSSSNTGNYELYAQSTNDPSGAQNLPFGETQTGTISSAAQSNTYTFSANANDVVDFTMTTTSGSLSPKIRLYNPSGALVNSAENGFCSGATIEMNTVTLPSTGTYTVLVGDCSDTQTGNYDIYAQRTDHASGAAKLGFGQAQAGAINSAAQSNTYAFSGNKNDVVDLTMVTTSGTLSPKIRLYEPSGALLASASNGFCSGATIEMNAVTLPSAGTYTVLVGDCSDTYTGDYEIYAQRTNNPSGAATLRFGPAQTGLIGEAAQSSTYIFAGSQNDHFDFTMVTTNGSLSPKMRLYEPNGTLVASASNGFCSGATLEMNTVTLPATGTYTLLVGDCSDTDTGNYEIYAQSTNNPFGPGPVLWGDVQTGDITSAALSTTYTFSGVANNVIDLTMTTTSGTLSPKIRLYNPDGTLLASASNGFCSGSTIGLNSITLAQDGNYTVLLGDCSDTNSGNYNLSSQCFGTCLTMPAITWRTPAPISYGTKLSGTQLNATANTAGTFVYSPPSGTLLAPGPHNLAVTFTPTNTSEYSTATDRVQLTVQLAATSTSVVSSLNPSTYGQSVTFTATVTSSGGTPPGTVTFKDGSATLGTGKLSGGTATFTTSTLSVGSHSITAVYGGSVDFAGSTSSILTQTVNQAATSTSVTSSLNPSTFGQPVTFTATVTSAGGTPTGTVTFNDGSSALGTGTLSGGTTTFTTSTLSVGTHSITAVYGGSTSFSGSTSPVLSQVVNQ